MNRLKQFCCAVVLVLCSAAAWSLPDANELMRKNFFATKVSGFSGDVSITMTTSRGAERIRKMSVRSKLRDNGVDSAILTRFLQPGDIRGTGFLQIENSRADDDIWVYLPALGKTRRLASNNKRDSFFGTDFAYGDLLLPAVDKYQHKLLRRETLDGNECFVLESTPTEAKTRDDSGYSRRLSWIDARSFVERKVEYYDVSGALLKTQLTSELREVDPAHQRWLPMRREMNNHQTGHKTIYRFDRFELDTVVTDVWFSSRRLEEK